MFYDFAGFPATTQFSGTSFVTTEPAPITASFPIVTPDKIVEFEPIHTFLPILIGAGYIDCLFRVKYRDLKLQTLHYALLKHHPL